MRLRPISIAAVIVTAGATLVGCAPWYAVDGCTPTFEPGGASNRIDPTADTPFEAPIAVNAPQASITGGEGDPAEAGDVVVTDYSLYDGSTGTLLETSDADAATAGGLQAAEPLTRATGGEDDPLGQALTCAQAGSTVTYVSSFEELFGESIAQAGVDPQATAVMIFQVERAFDGRASGWPQPAVAGLPSISIAPDGRPGITWAGTPAPTTAQSATTIQGGGEEVAATDTVVVQYALLEWGADTVRQSTWENGAPASLPLDGVIAPFADAVVGQQVGSQVVLAVPSDDAYGDGDLLFVIDILDVVST